MRTVSVQKGLEVGNTRLGLFFLRLNIIYVVEVKYGKKLAFFHNNFWSIIKEI
jgi:hypothetical protein